MIIGDYIARRVQLDPDKIALVDTVNGNREISYRQWAAAINQTANWLLSLGVVKGDRVAVLAMNCQAYLDVWLACGRVGAILQNLNWRLTGPELYQLLLDAEPTVLIYGPDFIAQLPHLRSAPSVRHWVALADPAAPTDTLLAERDRFAAAPPPLVSLAWDDPWVICYTGGTTGLPKGALLTHRAMLFNAFNTITGWGLTPDDTAILNAPLFHTGGLNVFTFPLIMIGGCSILCRTFEVDQVYDWLESGRVTHFFGVPTMFTLLQQHPRWAAADFSALKLIISGGAPCPLPIFEAFWARGVDFKTGYGLTEAGPNTFWLPPADVRRKPGYVGFPLPFVAVKIIRPDGIECGLDEPGELIISGPHVCAGYWRDEEATAAAIHPTPSDPTGSRWLHTGDLAIRDHEGYIKIIDRLKDMIISGGENIYPAEIESVLHAHPAVAEAAVIGQPDPKWGEVGEAIVVLKPGHTATADDLLTFCAARLARYKLPRTIRFVDQLPKTGANKIDKKLLKGGIV
ncbi:MAG: long-chain fatty acid--CoA ligase [Anaerolineae bacterium]|nr:long-chain fatty acid--CoA ligase [Anaerolineae bacterium]